MVPGEPDQTLSSINSNSFVVTYGLHSTLYNDFSESGQEAIRALASLSNSRNSTPFSPLLSPMIKSTDIGGSHAQRLPSAKVMFMYLLTCVDVLAIYFCGVYQLICLHVIIELKCSYLPGTLLRNLWPSYCDG